MAEVYQCMQWAFLIRRIDHLWIQSLWLQGLRRPPGHEAVLVCANHFWLRLEMF